MHEHDDRTARETHGQGRTMTALAVGLSASLALVAAPILARVARPRSTVVFWTDSRGGDSLTITVDGRVAGALTEYFPDDRPPCAEVPGVLRLELTPGSHLVVGQDALGRAWSRSIRLASHQCVVFRFSVTPDAYRSQALQSTGGALPLERR